MPKRKKGGKEENRSNGRHRTNATKSETNQNYGVCENVHSKYKQVRLWRCDREFEGLKGIPRSQSEAARVNEMRDGASSRNGLKEFSYIELLKFRTF